MNRKEKFSDTTIVIPVYNESKNLQILIAKILRKYPAIRVVMVDDSDKAENLKLRKILSRFGRNVRVISRFKKMGRGSAVIEGLKFSIKNKKTKIFFEMDADLAHDPEELPLFLKAIKSSDMVVGSRYLSKSKIIKWPIARLIQSRIINLFLKLLLGLKLSDYTNGYRAYSRRAVEFLVKQKLREKGFISLSETAFKLKKARFKISEVPITFRDRKFGKSSANINELISSLFGAFRVRFSETKSIFKFTSNPLFYAFLSLVFFYFNYSFYTWNFFDRYFGLAGAKAIPEVIGIVFFLFLAKIYFSKFYPKQKVRVDKKDFFTLVFLAAVGFTFHFKQFYTYFWKDDFYYVLNRFGTSYSFYNWGPWVSSYSLWVWELIRSIFGYVIFPYQLATILSHVLLGIGVYFLAKYLSKNYYVGVITSFLVLTTTISFEAFQWISHPMNFAWQGFFICLSLIALVWETEKSKGKRVPYLSAFIIMPAFGSGIARIGFILPLVSAAIFLASVKFFTIKRAFVWLRNLLINQWIFYAMVFVFFTTRNLLGGGSVKTEVFTVPLYKVYFYLIGIFTFPVEFFVKLSKLTKSMVPPGLLTVWVGVAFLVAVFLIFVITKLRRRPFPIILSLGFFWLTFSALYYTLFAPHLPATDNEINNSVRTHHLSYLGLIGSLMIWGFVFYKILDFLWKIKKPFGQFIVGVLIVGSFITSNVLLSRQYNLFLDFAKGVTIPRPQFFFETYRKYIPADAKKVNIFYDDGALKRRDNYKPNEYYFWAFWDSKNVRILYGDSELKSFLASFKDLQAKDSEINSLYGIYTDYDNGLIEDNLSLLLRDSVYNPKFQSVSAGEWKLYWGTKKGNVFLPEIFYDRNVNVSYFKNPVMFVDQLNLPSILTPKLKIVLNVQEFKNGFNYVDLRAGILSQLLNNWTLPSNDQIPSLVKYYFDNPSQSVLAFNDLLNSVHVNDKMVCGQNINNGGVAFLITWLGESDSYYLKNRNKELLSGYLDRYYSICYFSDVQGDKNINIELPNLGSILRQIVIIPLTRQPISIELLDATLKTPQILK